jgi:phosphate/sulfate permease
VALAVGFAATNGLHDASNAIASLVAARGATPLQAIVLLRSYMLGPLLVGAAVADTIGAIVTVPPDEAIEVIGAGLAAAVTWNLVRGVWVCRRASDTPWLRLIRYRAVGFDTPSMSAIVWSGRLA